MRDQNVYNHMTLLHNQGEGKGKEKDLRTTLQFECAELRTEHGHP